MNGQQDDIFKRLAALEVIAGKDTNAEILSRIVALEVLAEGTKNRQEEIVRIVTNVQNGIGLRVEQSGKDIAVIDAHIKSHCKEIDDIKADRKWVITSMAAAFGKILWDMLRRA